MLIKYQALKTSLQKAIQTIYVLVGQDHYLLNDAAYQIKKAWRQLGESDDKVLHLANPADWTALIEESNSYSLFADHVLLDARYEKKSLDRGGQQALKQYLQHSNPRCLIILRAPNLSAKQLQWLNQCHGAVVVQIYSFNDSALQSWISQQLHHHHIRHEPQIPALIHQFTQGNMLACAQVLEKLKLLCDSNDVLTEQEVMEQLSDQCDYPLYELSDACLAANIGKALHLIRQSSRNRTEPTLILWLLTQEIRQLIQLTYETRRSGQVTTACNNLKIWPKRVGLYQKMLPRQSLSNLYQLLRLCKELDEHIKSNQNQQIWQKLEALVLALCAPQSV